jgi:hypothetical protein
MFLYLNIQIIVTTSILIKNVDRSTIQYLLSMSFITIISVNLDECWTQSIDSLDFMFFNIGIDKSSTNCVCISYLRTTFNFSQANIVPPKYRRVNILVNDTNFQMVCSRQV